MTPLGWRLRLYRRLRAIDVPRGEALWMALRVDPMSEQLRHEIDKAEREAA